MMLRTKSLLLLVLVACTSPPDRPTQPATIDEAVQWTGILRLQETDAALVGTPNLRVDPTGGWLYWDTQSDQARRYGVDGALLSVIGGPGNGPGEFSGLRGLIRMSSGRLATIDGAGRMAIWTDSGEVARSIQSDVGSVWGAAALPEEAIVIASAPRHGGSDLTEGRMIHRLRLDSEDLISAEFTPSVAPEDLTAALSVQGPAPRVIGDSIYFALGAFDTVWALPVPLAGDGRALSVNSEAMANNPPSPPPGPVGGAVQEWLAGSTFLGDFVRLSDGRWLIATWGQREGRTLWGLVLLSPRGERVWELQDTPRLLEVDEQDRVYFWDPQGLEPAAVRVARVR